MRIQGPHIDLGSPRPSSRAGTPEATKPDESGVKVSASTQLQSGAQAKRAERVAEIQKAIESGSYAIDRKQLAEKLADEELARAVQR